MTIDGISNGVVIDHISAGKGMEIYNHLFLNKIQASVAIITNAKSQKQGIKDIIKIENEVDLNLDILGYIDPNITINIVVDGKIVDKKQMKLPEQIVGILTCKNPRCITTTETALPQTFILYNGERHHYRCLYCKQNC